MVGSNVSALTGAAMCEFLLEFFGLLTAGAAVSTVVPSGSRSAHSSGSPCGVALRCVARRGQVRVGLLLVNHASTGVYV